MLYHVFIHRLEFYLQMITSSISTFFFVFFLTLSCVYSPTAECLDYPTANLSTTWNNVDSAPNTINFQDGSMVISILLRNVTSFGTQFVCGFLCNGTCISFLFGVFIVHINDGDDFAAVSPQVVWSANRDYPIGLGATLNLTADGRLVLQDLDGSVAWTTNTSQKSVVGMNLTRSGNLVLFDVHNSAVWQSFDHPTDCLLPGQKLFEGQKLTASVSSIDWTTRQSLYSLTVTRDSLFANFESNLPPNTLYTYWNFSFTATWISAERSYVRFMNGSLSLFYLGKLNGSISIPVATSTQYMKLMSDGHLKVYAWNDGWTTVADVFTYSSIYTYPYPDIGPCGYPLACGRTALCSGDQQCSCPLSPMIDYFRPVNDGEPDLGCYEINPLTCNATQDQDFVALNNYVYFTFRSDIKAVHVGTCIQACLNNCSCKAAVFGVNLWDKSQQAVFAPGTTGDCFLSSDLFTLMETTSTSRRVTMATRIYIKVQKASRSTAPGPLPKRKGRVTTILGSSIGSFFVLIVVVVGFITFIVHKRKKNVEIEEEYLDQVPGMPTRFSYEKLQIATQDFSKKLGEGGFGSVFEGTSEDGSKVAVKRLEGLAYVKKSFLAEVQSIGSIHHVNLVRLRGFCAWKSQRLLVYDFMSNGSLDQWIYQGSRGRVLNWECRKKIIIDIAKGLAYLHEECQQKIIHLDIKPQNILLDNDFNAKVSDFGLSKLIDKNQSQVMTTMRGTPGYMAPEWLSSIITEKVDVYSFGIVLLEILCGRKNFDRCQPEESWHLLWVFQKCWEQEKLIDLVDGNSEDMQQHGTEVVEMMKVASWCLQTDFTRRPSMSTVIKVLEGVMNVEVSLDYNFSDPRLQKTAVEHKKDQTPLLPSVLSRPR